jgi:hypothetical protein
VRSVIAASILASSMFSVSGRMSTNTGTPPRTATALAVETNVNEGMITSSPGPIPARMIAISSAAEQEGVISASAQPTRSRSHSEQRRPKTPLPDSWPSAMASSMLACSRPTV